MQSEKTKSGYRIILLSIVMGFVMYALPNLPLLAVNNSEVYKITTKDSANSIKTLARAIEGTLTGKRLNNSSIAISVYSLDQKKYLYEKNVDKLMIPASTTKLVTSYSALKLLGYDFMVRTSVYTDGVIRDSILEGNLYLYGRGDVLMTQEDMNDMAGQIASQGIKTINGNIYADGSFFDDVTGRKEYSGDKDVVEPIPPVTALGMYKNTITVVAHSPKSAGKALNVHCIPNSSLVTIRSSAKSTNAKVRRRSLKVRSKMIKDSLQRVSLSGRMRKSRTYSYRYFMHRPDLISAGALERSLKDSGITINGVVAQGQISDITTEKALKLMSEFERPLLDFVYVSNKDSDNFIAETLFKMIGGNYKVSGVTAEDARSARDSLMLVSGLPFENCILNDGSGLSRRNRLTADFLSKLLIKSENINFGPLLDSTLSIAGIDGTLESRMRNSTAEFNLRGKTGTLANASALAGYVTSLDGERLVFVCMFRGRYVWDYKQAENKIGLLLSQFFYFNDEG